MTRSEWLRGFSWLPDGSGLVYSSSRGSTILYPPVFNLRVIGRDGRGDRQLTFGDLSYVEPDVHQSGKLLVSRIRGQSDVWRFPIGGSAAENTRDAVRITRQTGQAQTPIDQPRWQRGRVSLRQRRPRQPLDRPDGWIERAPGHLRARSRRRHRRSDVVALRRLDRVHRGAEWHQFVVGDPSRRQRAARGRRTRSWGRLLVRRRPVGVLHVRTGRHRVYRESSCRGRHAHRGPVARRR